MSDPKSSPDEGSAFPFGLRLFLRTSDKDGNLHFVNLPTAREIRSELRSSIFSILDKDGKKVAIVNKRATSCILSLDAEGKAT